MVHGFGNDASEIFLVGKESFCGYVEGSMISGMILSVVLLMMGVVAFTYLKNG